MTYGIESIIEKIVPYFFISLLLLIYINRKEIKKARIFFTITIIYCGIQLFFGARGIVLIQILMVVILWYTAVKKMSKKLVIALLILIIPISYLISFIGTMREYPINEWSDKIIEGKAFEENFLVKTMNEMGIAIYPTAATMILVPEKIEYQYGITFMAAFTTIIPNLGSGEHFANQYMNFISKVAKEFRVPFGGSIVAEGFVNFGWFAPLFFVLLGYLMIAIEQRVENARKTNEMVYPLYIFFSVYLLWTVRNTLSTLIIYSLRYALLIYIAYYIFKWIYYKNRGHMKKVENNLTK